MRYLLINGSPHKGNTWKLAELAQQQILQLAPDSVFQAVHLSTLELPFCTGCSRCFRLGGSKCPHFSVIGNVLEKLEWADGIIFATATYNLAPTALVKNLMDHLCYLLHRPRFFTKKALVIATTGGIGAAKAAKSLAGDLAGIGFNRVSTFAVQSLSWNDYQPGVKTLKRLAGCCTAFQRDVASRQLHNASALLMIPYNLFRGMSLSCAPDTPYPTRDGVHWTDPARANSCYGPPIPVPFYKKPLAAVFYLLGKRMGKHLLVTYKKEPSCPK